MKRQPIFSTGTMGSMVAALLLIAGCMGSTPIGPGGDEGKVTGGPRTYDKEYRLSSSKYDGVDLLIVVDNSGSMADEQQILAEQFFPLINRFTQPVQGDPSWSFPRVENLNVAVVTTNMGLQYGDGGNIDLSPTMVFSCEYPQGDNGTFRPIPWNVGAVSVPDGFVRCDPNGDQCPDGFVCTDGFCESENGTGLVACTDDGLDFTTAAAAAPGSGIATQTACLAQQGTRGCGFEQQLEAMLRGAETHPSFIEENHVLAVILVTDEEDCSIEDPALFSTEEWRSATEQNIACNVGDNTQFLFDPARYRSRLKALKGGRDDAVVFAAIAGVPIVEDSPCEGTGTELAAAECLAREEMAIEPMQFTDEATGTPYIHFRPACTRQNAATGRGLTEARPGRRIVEVAQSFGNDGLVQSICNADWGPGLEAVGETVARKLTDPCFPTEAPWTEAPSDECPTCGTVSDGCNLYIEYKGDETEMADFQCPNALYSDLSDDERAAYLAEADTETADGTTTVYCPVPKIAAPLSCGDDANDLEDEIGWTYCENDGFCDQKIEASPTVQQAAAGNFYVFRCRTLVK